MIFIINRLVYQFTKPNSVLNDENGFANIAGGLKYSFYQDPTSGTIASVGFRFEDPSGEKKVLQGQGDGIYNLFASVGTSLCKWNFIAGTGFRIPSSNDDSSSYDFDAHVDYDYWWFRPTFEVSLVNVLSAGNRLPIADERQDFFNLGSTLSDGKTMVNGSVGARFIVKKDLDIGLAYQFPFDKSSGTYITDWRLTSDLIYRF